jgi:hypothetical protein
MLLRCLLLAAVLAHAASAAQYASNAGLKPQRWESVNGSAWGFFQVVRKPKGTVVSARPAAAVLPPDPLTPVNGCADAWPLLPCLAPRRSLSDGREHRPSCSCRPCLHTPKHHSHHPTHCWYLPPPPLAMPLPTMCSC